MKYFVNTDSVDIRNRQIGVHLMPGKDNREHCIGVNHLGTRESVHEATRIAQLIAAAPELLEAAKQAQCSCSVNERISGHLVGCWMPTLLEVIEKAEGKS